MPTVARKKTRTTKKTGKTIQKNPPALEATPIDTPTAILNAQEREQAIATAAYYRAQARDFEPGFEMDDWLEAERELERESLRREKG